MKVADIREEIGLHDGQPHDGKSMDRLVGDSKFGATPWEIAFLKYRELRGALRGRMFWFVVLAPVTAALLTALVCIGTAPFFFVVSLRTSDAGASELYYDVGRGINAADSSALHLYEGNSTLRFPLQASLYHSIRFDPIDHGYCDVTVREVKIVTVSGDVIRSFAPGNFTKFHDISNLRAEQDRVTFSLRAADKDPSLTILLEPSLKLASSPWTYRYFALRIFLLTLGLIALLAGAWLFLVRKEYRQSVFGGLILGLFVYVAARSRFYAPINFDEASFLWYGAVVNAGGIPYRDIFEPKGPVIFFANAIGLSLFGLPNFQFRIVPTVCSVASIFLLYIALLRRQIVQWLAFLVAAQVALWLLGRDFHDSGLNDSETYGFAFTIIGLSLGFIARSVRLPATAAALQIGSGIFFAVAVLTKELFVFSVAPAWLFLGFRQNGKGLDRRSLLLCATGAIFVGVLFLGYLMRHSALSGYLHELAFARRLAADYHAAIGRFPRVTGPSMLWQSWRMLHEQLYNVEHLAFVLTLCAAALLTGAKAAINFQRLSVAALAVLLGIVSISVGYCFWKHYFLMGATGILLLTIWAADRLSRHLNAARSQTNLLVCLVLLAALLVIGWGPTRSMLLESYSPRVADWDPIVTETIEQHSVAGDYVLAPGVPALLVAMHRRNPYVLAGPSDSILPYVPALPERCQIDSLRRDLEQNLPKVCYFPAWFRSDQKICQELIYQPVLSKHNYIKVNDTLWYLSESKK